MTGVKAAPMVLPPLGSEGLVRLAEGWEVAHWINDEWWLTGNEVPFANSSLLEIGPRLLPPDQQGDRES
jgi:hypothetical protein